MRCKSLCSSTYLLWSLWSGSTFFLWRGLLIIVIGTLTTVLFTLELRQDEQDINRLVQFVETAQSPALLGTILDLCDHAPYTRDRHSTIHTASMNAVYRLLPLIQSQDAGILNIEQRQILRRYAFSLCRNPAYSIARSDKPALSALRALEHIGDKQDLADIEMLLTDHYSTKAVRIAAEHCAEVIRERVAREEGKDFLLRPEREPVAVATLLRPSEERSDTPTNQLLRPVSAEDATPDPAALRLRLSTEEERET